jgi:hypothetical protein
MSGQRHAEQLPHGMPPGRDVLPEAAPYRCWQHAAHAEADVRGVAHDTARQPPVQLKGGRGVAHSARAIDPYQHPCARERHLACGGLLLADDLSPRSGVRLTRPRHALARRRLDLVVSIVPSPVAPSRRLATIK